MQGRTRASILSVVLVLASVLPATVHAVDGIVQFGYEFGGETVARVYYTDGGSDSVKANMGINLAAGLGFGSTEAGGMQLQLLGGFVFGGAGASNGGVQWRASHMDALVFYSFSESVRLGGGVSWHMNPETKSTGDLSGLHYVFDNALGYRAVLEFDGGGLLVGLRYTMIDYTFAEVDGIDVSAADVSVDGNSTGLYIGWRW